MSGPYFFGVFSSQGQTSVRNVFSLRNEANDLQFIDREMLKTHGLSSRKSFKEECYHYAKVCQKLAQASRPWQKLILIGAF